MQESAEFKLVWRDLGALAAAAQKDVKASGFLSRARALSSIGSNAGSAVAVVLDGDEYVDVIYLVKNPDVRSDAECKVAEKALLDAIIREEEKTVRLSARAAMTLAGSEEELGFKKGDDSAWLVPDV